jgi:hypothetical protein
MKKIMIVSILVLAALATPLFLAPKQAQCGSSTQIFSEVLCCCNTWGGGQCCKWVTFCGAFIPGCMCS